MSEDELLIEAKHSLSRLQNPNAVHYTSEESKREMIEELQRLVAALEDVPVQSPQPELTRDYLIDLCERAIVDVSLWSNRDTPHTIEKVGLAWALLKAGCDWVESVDPKSDRSTIWIRISYPSFNNFEYDRNDPQYFDHELIYLPTEEKLKQREGMDWY